MGFFQKLFGCGGTSEPEAPTERTLMNIQVGDIVQYFGDDYQVFATIEWMEDGFSWKEYKLKNREDAYWISAEVDDGDLIAGFYKVVKDFNVTLPPANELEYNGKKFKLDEKGSAVGKLTSKAGTQNYKCKYYEYYDTADKAEMLSIEDYDGDIEVSLGTELRESEIDILPGG